MCEHSVQIPGNVVGTAALARGHVLRLWRFPGGEVGGECTGQLEGRPRALALRLDRPGPLPVLAAADVPERIPRAREHARGGRAAVRVLQGRLPRRWHRDERGREPHEHPHSRALGGGRLPGVPRLVLHGRAQGGDGVGDGAAAPRGLPAVPHAPRRRHQVHAGRLEGSHIRPLPGRGRHLLAREGGRGGAPAVRQVVRGGGPF